mmetsp:Transcript_60674/g.160549  ORF Transcript_60674/g.160549 Transcript_60674/m.160549 type:complete len:331 (-) Transcript_60674:128-1120(-)
MRLTDETAELYQPFKDALTPAYNAIVASALMANPDAERILDLCCGLGEPACSLARAYPASTVTCSDISAAMVERAMTSAAKQAVRLDGVVMEMDNLAPIESSSQDIVTISFGLMYTTDHSRVLREVLRVLKPGGMLIATVWSTFSLVPLVTAAMAEVIQTIQAANAPAAPSTTKLRDAVEPIPPNVRLGPPIDPLSLADSKATDVLLASVGFMPMMGHNASGEMKVDLGQAFGRKTWKFGCTPVYGTLCAMQEEENRKEKKRQQDVFKHAKTSFDKAAIPYVARGRVVLPASEFRCLVVVKPVNCCTTSSWAVDRLVARCLARPLQQGLP